MAKFKLKINGRVELIVDNEVYKSIIQDIGKDKFWISTPTKKGSIIALHVGDVIEMLSYQDENLIYKFKVTVLYREIDESGIPLYTFDMPKKVCKFQRRNDVRVNTLLDLEYYVFNYKDKKFNTKDKLNAKLLDLSGGGLKLKTKEKLQCNDLILINLNLEDEEFILKGNVVRSENSTDGEYEYGIKFLDLDFLVRDKIIKIIFKIMRRQRKVL